MGSYIPGTPNEQQTILEESGFSSFDELFAMVPDHVRMKEEYDLPKGKSELEVSRAMHTIAGKNRIYEHIFRGAGSYHHFIPPIVKSVISKEEFITSYTPYQAEISQGILQGIFEFQTMICELTGMDVANASHYDGATAAAESIAMCKERKRTHAYVSETTHPAVIEVMQTYCFASDTELTVVPKKDGITDVEALKQLLSEDEKAAVFYVQQPNFFGNFEPAEKMGELVHEAGAKYVMGVNPIALAIMKSPRDCHADIVVGDGQPLGLSMAYGGPYVGLMATTQKLMRKLPGRIVGETVDSKGKRAFVLTLQAREQHIRREKASSNICSNQDLCALTAAVYMSAMGAKGLEDVAMQSMSKAHYLKEQLAQIGYTPKYDRAFFHEFVTKTPIPAKDVLAHLDHANILGGYPVEEDAILWCTTEMVSKQDMDDLIEQLREVAQ